MKSMEVHHDHGNGILSVVLWIAGVACMIKSNAEPSEVRAWITFGLGALASIISITLNWKKWVDMIKSSRKKKTKNKQNGK